MGYASNPGWQVNLTTGSSSGPYTRFIEKKLGDWRRINVTRLEVGSMIRHTDISFSRVPECAGQGISATCIARNANNDSLLIYFPPSLQNGCAEYEGWYADIADGTSKTTCFAQTLMGGDGGSGEWCAMKDTLGFINIVAIILYGNTYKFQLPPNVYYACGFNAYKWLPYEAVGSCTLARLTSATWVWDSKDIPNQQIPKHMLYKRSQRPKAKELVHLPWQKKCSLSLTLVGLSVHNAHTIEKLADLFDNVTEYVFDALNNTNAMAEQLILVTNQHAMVLDYLTASQGMCQIVGPAGC